MSKEDRILDLLQGIISRLDELEAGQAQIKEDLAHLKEDSAITQGALNYLVEWADKVSKADRFPLPRV